MWPIQENLRLSREAFDHGHQATHAVRDQREERTKGRPEK
jgi:hypothetical protein